jgi:ABC-2 type transport system ATP-binding protein
MKGTGVTAFESNPEFYLPSPPVETVVTGSGPAVSTHDLTKRFGSVTALNRFTVEVPRGVTLGLLGPNGAGKTTLLRILLGLTAPSEGHAEVLGESVPSRSVLDRIGYMPQELATYTDLSVEENLELFGRLYGLRGAPLRSRIAVVLELVKLADRRRSVVVELSGGMRRRVSFAAALLADPELLLLDEPTVGVDPQLRADFWSYFRRLNEAGKTIVMTTHYMEEATHCDLVALVYGGELLARGSPASIRATSGASTMEDAFLALVRAKNSRGH